MPCRLIAACFALAILPAAARALDYVTIQQAGKTTELAGRVEVEAVDGGVLFLGTDGVLWPIPKEELAGRRKDDKPFEPLPRDEVNKRLLAELPAGFKLHQTKNYVICYNTSAAYAQWVGALYERLFAGFYNYWTRRGIKLHEPKFPLVALVFDSRDSYARFSQPELGESVRSIIGYYSLRSNRMIMYDLSGADELRAAGPRVPNATWINHLLSQPAAERMVATIVHEATHQLAFNSGLQVRFADIPFWVSEGIAIYFESPDLDNAKGWQKIGAVNRVNLINFRKALKTRPAGAFQALLAEDKQFRDPATAADAYAEAWALNYYLLRTKSEAYAGYLEELATQTPLVAVEPAARIVLFQKHFGDDLTALETEFLKYMRGVD